MRAGGFVSVARDAMGRPRHRSCRIVLLTTVNDAHLGFLVTGCVARPLELALGHSRINNAAFQVSRLALRLSGLAHRLYDEE